MIKQKGSELCEPHPQCRICIVQSMSVINEFWKLFFAIVENRVGSVMKRTEKLTAGPILPSGPGLPGLPVIPYNCQEGDMGLMFLQQPDILSQYFK